MKAAVWLRIAAVVTLAQAVLHTVGAVFGDLGPGPATVAVAAMRANQFVVMGHLGSYSDFYRALGLGVTIFLTAEAIVFWQLSLLAKTDARAAASDLGDVPDGVRGAGGNVGDLLIRGAVIREVLIAACLGMAIVGAGSGVGADKAVAQRA